MALFRYKYLFILRYLKVYVDNNNIVSLRPLVKSKFIQLKKLHFSNFPLIKTKIESNKFALLNFNWGKVSCHFNQKYRQ
jgi:hypothetical protein